jgi:hypothetical protein
MRRPVSLLLALASTLACSDSQGPGLSGSPFLRLTVDGQPVTGLTSQAGCGDFSFILSAAPLSTAIPDADVLEIRLAGLHRRGSFQLASVASGSFARTFTLRPAGFAFQTDSLEPGRLTISGLSFRDSLVAGSFAFRLFNLLPSSTSHSVSGSFRLSFGQIFTVDHPEGTTCQAAGP